MPFAGLDGLKSPYVFLMSEWSVCIVLYLRFG
jgi:hypothetical protein